MNKLTNTRPAQILSAAMTLWFVVAIIGQWIFAAYTVLFYGGAWIRGQVENWNTQLPNGYVAGDAAGNGIVGLHLLLTIIIMVGGSLQLMPKVRSFAPVFHRWLGRVYLGVALVMSLTGLYMVWVRGSIGGIVQHVSISLNALLMMVAVAYAFKYARERNFYMHRIWAIRLFLLVNGVWFFRVGLFFWLWIQGGPVGFDPETFQGPFLSLLSFSQYFLPLLLFELYQTAVKRNTANFSLVTAGVLVLFTLIMAIGIFNVSVSVWFPKMF